MSSELEGIGKLRRGALILVVVPVLVAIATVLVGFTIESELLSTINSSSYTTQPLSSPISSASSLLTTIGIGTAIVFIGVILVLLGYWYLRKGFKTLVSLGRDVGIGSVGGTLFFVSLGLFVLGVLVLIGSFAAALTSASSTNPETSMNALGDVIMGIFGGAAITIIGVILEIIGNVLIGIGFYRVGDIYNEGTTKVGGILVAIGAVLSFLVVIPSYGSLIAVALFFVGFILVYVGLGKVRSMPIPQPNYFQPMPSVQPTFPTTPQAPAQPTYPTTPQIYPTAQGVIREDGSAFISLYSTTTAVIISARIEGTTLSSVNINPVLLQPGQNAIVIKFDNVSPLARGTTYVITLAVNIGGNVSEIKVVTVYQP